MTEFEAMGLRTELLSSIKKMGFTKPTEVQDEAIPVALQGKDITVRAKTGTGKTGAFLVPIINSIRKDEYDSALIIVPTRELALQVTGVAKQLCADSGLKTTTVYGGASMNVQMSNLQRKVNIIIGTPGRIIDFIKRGVLLTGNIRFLVLDEADIMFEMGFIEDIEWIISKLPSKRQTMLFSATMPDSILRISKRYMKEPTKISIGNENEVTVSTISHYYAIANGRKKLSTLIAYIKEYKPGKTIIFSATQRGANLIYTVLKKEGFDAVIMHGGLTQAKREYSLSDFRKGTQFLIATNVAARGLDITDVSDIINFDVSEEPTVYVHRVGRSARMGAEGRAFSIFPDRDKYLIGAIEEAANVKMTQLELNTAQYRDVENMPNTFYRETFHNRENGNFRGNNYNRFNSGRERESKPDWASGRFGHKRNGSRNRFKRGRFNSRYY